MTFRLWGAAVMVAVFIVSGTAVADPGAEQQQADQNLAEAEATLEGATEEAREAGKVLADIKAKLPDAEDRVNTARGVASAAQVLATAAAEEAEQAIDDHTDAEDDYTVAATSVDDARGELGDLVKATYQGANLVAVNAVLNSSDPIEAAERMSWVNHLVHQQDDAVNEVVRLRQDARDAENVAEIASDDAIAAQEAADAALDTAESELAAAEEAESDLQGLMDSQQDALDIAESERDASLAQYEEAEAESARIAKALKDAGSKDDPAPSKPTSSSSGKLQMPVSGYKSSDFGNRFDPYYNVWQLHAGTDFAAGGGAPIYAAEGGTVNQAGWNGGYGNYTCIYHGDNMSTCYGHQSQISVSVGQSVGRGQQIGSVGTTGASTGDHLHFEVRINGNPVQPLDWLPGCLC